MDININIKERSYGGKRFRPSPVITNEKESNLLLCTTVWGDQEALTTINDTIKNFIALANEDSEFTIPYAHKDNLHHAGNILRMSVMRASEKINDQYNRDEYTTGFEIFAAIKDGPQWIYVNCGQPSIFIWRKNLGLLALSQSIDLNVLTPSHSVTDPLPNQILGLGQMPPIQYGNIFLKQTDKIGLISRTSIPSSFYSLKYEDFNIDKSSRLLANADVNVPFWSAFLEFN